MNPMVTKASFNQTLRDLWNTSYQQNILHAPFATYDWHVTWHQTLGDGYESYILVVDDAIVAPFARKNNEILFSGGEEISDYQDLIGPQDKKAAAWQEIMNQLRLDGITAIHLRNVPEHSPTLAFFQNVPNATITKEDTTPVMNLPTSWGAFIESLSYKPRHELERKMRKFEREHQNIRIVESNTPGGDIHILLNLMHKDEKKHVFLTTGMSTFFERIALTFAPHISLLLLYMDDTPAAATLSFIYEGASLLYNSGFDKECCKNAGFYLKAKTIKHAIEKNLPTYNFLQGSERYKYELGGRDFFVYSISHSL
jgi:CelD/BcsL family acetyltransferase involved in cellulose biosynthesis